MPADLHCSNCSLVFSVGRFHGHIQKPDYFGYRLMVCKSCGTQHLYKYAMKGREYFSTYNLFIEKIPESVRNKLALWLRTDRNISLTEALRQVKNPPVVVASSVHEAEADFISRQIRTLGIFVLMKEIGREPNPDFCPNLKDRLCSSGGPKYHEAPTEEWGHEVDVVEPTEDQAYQCLHCGISGTLIDDIEATDPCPACKKSTLNITSEWIT